MAQPGIGIKALWYAVEATSLSWLSYAKGYSSTQCALVTDNLAFRKRLLD